MAANDFNHEYKGYKLKIYNRSFKIYSELAGKFKMIRQRNCYRASTGNNQYGKTFNSFESDLIALNKAKEYIDIFFDNKTIIILWDLIQLY